MFIFLQSLVLERSLKKSWACRISSLNIVICISKLSNDSWSFLQTSWSCERPTKIWRCLNSFEYSEPFPWLSVRFGQKKKNTLQDSCILYLIVMFRGSLWLKWSVFLYIKIVLNNGDEWYCYCFWQKNVFKGYLVLCIISWKFFNSINKTILIKWFHAAIKLNLKYVS